MRRWCWVMVAGALAMPGAPAQAADVLTTGKRLVLTDDPEKPTRKRLKVVVKDAAVALGDGPGSTDDPSDAGGTLRVRSVAASFDHTYPLPAERWRPLGKPGAEKGYRFKQGDPVRVVILKRGKKIKVVAKGAGLGHDLAVDPGLVEVVLTLGALRHCTTFDTAVRFRPERKYVAKNGPRPAACPPDPTSTTVTTVTSTSTTTTTTMCVADEPCYDGPPGTAGVGECTSGVRPCVDGMLGGTCTGQVLPAAEVCNGLDEDCDGTTDEDVVPPCP